MKSKFIELVVEVVKRNNQSFELEIENRIIEIAEENYLDQDENVPTWLFEIFEAFFNNEKIERAKFNNEKYNKADYMNFLAELEKILKGEWKDYGEGVEIILPKIKMYAVILFEGCTYEVGFIKEE